MDDEIPEGYEVQRTGVRRSPDVCAWCGAELQDSGRGRPRRFCSQSCRQRDYELRTAERRYGRDREAGRARDRAAPVSQTVTRTRYVAPVRSPAAGAEAEEGPLRAREVQAQLERAAAAVASGELAVHDHGRVWRGMTALIRALDAAHPGGLDNLR